MSVRRALVVTPALRALFDHGVSELTAHRGGVELLDMMRRGSAPSTLLDELVAAGAVWAVGDGDGDPEGLAIVRDRIIEGLYVSKSRRRRGVAHEMVATLLASGDPPIDAFALPGDRTMKSLYESFGWKARLLTMRGE